MTQVDWRGSSASHTQVVTAGPPTLLDRTILLLVPQDDYPQALNVFRAAGAIVRFVPNVAALCRAAALLGPPALVVADLRTGAAQLRACLPSLTRQDAVVVLADSIMSEGRITLLLEGADHVARTGAPAEVVAMLANVLRRSLLSEPKPQARQAGDIRIDVARRSAQVCGRLLNLTVREFDLLAYFVANPEIVLSRETLLSRVWGYDIGDLSTVTVHVRRLRCKLEPDPAAPTYLKTIWGVGYQLALSIGA